MNNRLFDEHIKDRFSDYTPEVPAHIWKNIVAERNRRKPLGFWMNLFKGKNLLFLLLLSVGGGAGAWYMLGNTASKNNEATISRGQSTKNDASAQPPLNSDNNTIAATESSITPDRKNLNTSTTNSTTIFSPQQKGPVPNSITANDDATNSGRRKTSTTGSKNSISVTPAEATEDDQTNNESLAGGTLMGRLLLGVTKYASLAQNKDQKLQTKPTMFFPGCPEFEKDASANKTYFSIFAGPDIALRSFSDTGNSNYMQKRKESTKITSAYSAGISLTKVFANSMSVRGGATFGQINEKFTYSQGNVVQVTYIINAAGDTVGSYTTTGSRYKTTHNKYRSVDIPLTVGYEMGNGKLHANVNAGVVVNVYSWQKGEVLDTAMQPVSITTGKSASSPYQFKTNAGLGVTGGVSLFYKLNDKVHLMAEPYFRYNLKPISQENLTFKQKYNNVGVRLGLRIDLK